MPLQLSILTSKFRVESHGRGEWLSQKIPDSRPSFRNEELCQSSSTLSLLFLQAVAVLLPLPRLGEALSWDCLHPSTSRPKRENDTKFRGPIGESSSA